jgi:hypothetical protein
MHSLAPPPGLARVFAPTLLPFMVKVAHTHVRVEAAHKVVVVEDLAMPAAPDSLFPSRASSKAAGLTCLDLGGSRVWGRPVGVLLGTLGDGPLQLEPAPAFFDAPAQAPVRVKPLDPSPSSPWANSLPMRAPTQARKSMGVGIWKNLSGVALGPNGVVYQLSDWRRGDVLELLVDPDLYAGSLVSSEASKPATVEAWDDEVVARELEALQ